MDGPREASPRVFASVFVGCEPLSWLGKGLIFVREEHGLWSLQDEAHALRLCGALVYVASPLVEPTRWNFGGFHAQKALPSSLGKL